MAGYFTGGIVLLKGDGYRTDVGKAIERLEILGYTLNRVSDELKVSDESMDFEDLNYSDEEITRLNSDILSDYLNATRLPTTPQSFDTIR
jgi:glutamate synthase domain-containing protein 3